MTVLEPGSGDAFIFRIWKNHTSDPSVRWVNTYEARFTADGTTGDLSSLVAGLVSFEQALAFETTHFLYATVSTWEEDSHPYNPDSFMTVDLGAAGLRVIGTLRPLELRVCLSLRRAVSSGFQGKIELRNSLASGDVVAPAGINTLVDPAAMASAVSTAIIDADLGANMVGGLSQPKLAMIGTSEVTRFLTDIALRGVSNVPLNHKYFDRAPTP